MEHTNRRFEWMTAFARYNGIANRKMFEVIRGSSAETRLTENVGGYFGSLAALLNHLVLADRMWLHRLHLVWGELSVFAAGGAGAWKHPGDTFAVPLTELADIEAEQTRLDEILLRLMEEAAPALDANTVAREVVYTDSKGESVRIPVEGAILHLFNHHTHHRGQVSQVLDEMDIHNDYSNLRGTL